MSGSGRLYRLSAVALISIATARAQSYEYGEKWGYLESLLRSFQIPLSSQTLVFSKTSLQVERITPDHPRALYFTDEVYVGMVRGGPLEIAVADPKEGAIFYILDQKKTAQPKLVRKDEQCLKCHETVNTMKVRGFLTRSVFPDANGEPVLEKGAYLTDHRSPISQRWGGWFVSGSYAEKSLGIDPAQAKKSPYNPAAYPQPGSDLVALLVLNHQVGMHNWITKLHSDPSPANVEGTLRYFLFADEWKLRDKATGTSSFRADFEARGPFDSKGRSLRQLDLEHRLLRYPCSYLIYSASFEALPAMAKDLFYQSLFAVLTGKRPFDMSATDRRAILEILVETKPQLPDYFRVALQLH